MILAPRDIEYRHFHLFCGLGGGAKGFNAGRAELGHTRAHWRCLGGVDVDAGAIADFSRLAGVPGTVLDLFTREQYTAFHGHEPPDGWREATPDDLRRAAGGERPNVIFTSAPCKGFSGLLSESRSGSLRYQTLNQLAVRGLWLALEAWGDDPPEFLLFENVPRIQTRGSALIDTIMRMVDAYGYAAAPTTHCCGELGGLGQRRQRFLLVCRHRAKVPPFLYEPARRLLRAVGDVLGAFPLPGAAAAGPMHRMRELQWRTWVRLAFVEAGSDWRSLKKLRVVDGQLADFALVPDVAWHNGALGVTSWSEHASTITSTARPQNGNFAVADPRPTYTGEYQQLGVCPWSEPTGAVSGQSQPGGGMYSVADPRPALSGEWGGLGVTTWNQPAATIIGVRAPGQGRYAVADPRSGIDKGAGDYLSARHYGVVRWDRSTLAVTGSACHDNGAFSVADPRLPENDARHLNQWRVDRWDAPTHTIIGATRPGSGALCIADPRQTDESVAVLDALPAADARLVAVIRALDNTWHRPFTTLELAALQGLVDPSEFLELQGSSDTAWRERIGNAVPAPAAAAIASVMAEALLLAQAGETFQLSAAPIWVQPIAVALSVDPWREEQTA